MRGSRVEVEWVTGWLSDGGTGLWGGDGGNVVEQIST